MVAKDSMFHHAINLAKVDLDIIESIVGLAVAVEILEMLVTGC